MAYQALYRAWRPRKFSEIFGQDAVVTTLMRQISSGRIAHAYLFCGTRGTGKTSAAKVFSRAVNCLDTSSAEPCGKCEICQAILSESCMDVVEIDAASNNGVDEIRDLREKVKYPPTQANDKVSIIDEVPMLSTGAFNAPLKTLEDPPLTRCSFWPPPSPSGCPPPSSPAASASISIAFPPTPSWKS